MTIIYQRKNDSINDLYLSKSNIRFVTIYNAAHLYPNWTLTTKTKKPFFRWYRLIEFCHRRVLCRFKIVSKTVAIRVYELILFDFKFSKVYQRLLLTVTDQRTFIIYRQNDMMKSVNLFIDILGQITYIQTIQLELRPLLRFVWPQVVSEFRGFISVL